MPVVVLGERSNHLLAPLTAKPFYGELIAPQQITWPYENFQNCSNERD